MSLLPRPLCDRNYSACPFVLGEKQSSEEENNTVCVDLNKTSLPGILIENQILRMLFFWVVISISDFE
jgi:hypothetical protein